MVTSQEKRNLNAKYLQGKCKALKLVEKVISKIEVARKFHVTKSKLFFLIKNK